MCRIVKQIGQRTQKEQPKEGPHREVVGAAVVDSKLPCEVVEREGRMGRVETLLVFSVTALNFAVAPWGVVANELVPDTQLGSRKFKFGSEMAFCIGKAVGKLKAVVGLDALHADAPASVPFHQLLEEVSGGIGGLLGICGKESQACELVDSGVLEQAQLGVGDAATGSHLHVYLDALARIGHLLIGLRLVGILFLRLRSHPQLAHYPKQALGPAGIAPFSQPVPQLC